jgi:short-subunit dehydrogenase
MNIVITGASSGIGKALAQAYARGATQEQAVNLGLISRSQTALETLKAQLTTQYQVQASIYVVDVRDSDGMMQAAKAFMHQ